MGNRITLDRIAFQELDKDGSVTATGYGVRIADDHEATYVNVLDTKTDLMRMAAGELIQLVADNSDLAANLLQYARERGIQIWIDGEPVKTK
ncbi:hypothetical protein [Roseibium sp.]|uniref:hypothetical protein n=1 Tax=Roseibium sp. TaxID=1936156 RepID=UPI00391DD387